jgi:hypothetical protein
MRPDQAQAAHAATEEQFRALYRGKYAPLKEAHARCAGDLERLRRGRMAASEEAEHWKAQARGGLHACMHARLIRLCQHAQPRSHAVAAAYLAG